MTKHACRWASAAALIAFTMGAFTSPAAAPVSDTHRIERLVDPSPFHGVHGLTFDREDVLYAGSVVGESIYRVDARTGAVETFVGPPHGMADDLVFLADGTLVWTAISQGVVRARAPDGRIREIAKLPSINSINVRKSDGRLFAAQVFGGDGVWELDPSGAKPPRSILQSPGGFNGFDVGPDGMLYGPLWFKKQIVRIHPDTGEMKVIAAGFGTPAAANFDSKGNLYVLDTASGEVVRVDVANGSKHIIARLATSLDNLALDSQDRLFVSNMADNGVQEIDVRTGAARQVVKGELAMPLGIAAVTENGRDTLYVADVFALRSVDGLSGAVTDIARSHAAGAAIGYPIAVSASTHRLTVVNAEAPLQQYERSGRLLQERHDLEGAQNALELPDGGLVLAYAARGVVAHASPGGKPREIARKLAAPLGLALADGRAVYVSEMISGRVVRLDLDTGAVRPIAVGLQRPQGLAAAPDGAVLVVEVGRKRLVRVDPKTGAVTAIASELPIGLGVANALVGVATGAEGAIYLTSDVENSIWRLTPK
jgi:sugar lactone lactonase YvrE